MFKLQVEGNRFMLFRTDLAKKVQGEVAPLRKSWRPFIVWLVTLMTLGSGTVNLLSVMGRSAPPERGALLREVFPLEFLHLSRSLTLLIGFALIISSINIHKRKSRAFQIVLFLSCLSVTFHLTKGLDYKAAFFSALLVVLLLLTRRIFTVRSSHPDLRSGLLQFAIAGLVALSYGVAGFWLLDQREFGINFTLGDSIRRTLLLFSLVGDPQIVPHTRYAHWFVNSLYLMTAAFFVYAVYALFRPVIYQWRTVPQERALAGELVSRYGRGSLEYFKLWPDKSYFFSPSKRCFLAYRVGGSFAIVLGDPVGAEEEIQETIRGFMELCGENDWGLGFYQTLPDFLPLYKALGFRKLKIGDDAIVDLTKFTLEGKAMRKFRYTLTQMEKIGVHILKFEPPIAEDILLQVKEVSDEWLQIPGRRERGFTLGRFEPDYIRSTPLFAVADSEERILAFVNRIPSYRRGEATIDLMRHRTKVPNGIMDYLFVKLFLDEQNRKFERFSLGMAPMAGFQEKEEASREERAVHYFFQHLNFIFSYSGLREYKAKFASFWEPRYAIYRSHLDLPRLAMALGKVSELNREFES
jgi:phosphatidylglycerol lysyltransferase